MIAVDTSALMAIVLAEPQALDCMRILKDEDHVLMSATTYVEAMIVARHKNRHAEIVELIENLAFEIVSVTPATARRVSDIYSRWGKGFHAAALNFGDCFSYDVAKEHSCQLLYVGQNFAKTDIGSAL